MLYGGLSGGSEGAEPAEPHGGAAGKWHNAEEADGVKIASAYFTGTTGETLRGMCDSIRDKAVNQEKTVI